VAALARPVPGVPPVRAEREVGADAARRALSVHEVVALPAAAVVVELLDSGTIPAGDAPWAIGVPLRERMPATQVLPLHPGEGSPAALAERAAQAAQGRPLVVSARHTVDGTWGRRMVDALVEVRPDLVLVDHGRPGQGLTCRRVHTWSGSRVSADAAADLLAGR
jgi:beta-N-acetylhexosaminidase